MARIRPYVGCLPRLGCGVSFGCMIIVLTFLGISALVGFFI